MVRQMLGKCRSSAGPATVADLRYDAALSQASLVALTKSIHLRTGGNSVAAEGTTRIRVNEFDPTFRGVRFMRPAYGCTVHPTGSECESMLGAIHLQDEHRAVEREVANDHAGEIRPHSACQVTAASAAHRAGVDQHRPIGGRTAEAGARGAAGGGSPAHWVKCVGAGLS